MASAAAAPSPLDGVEGKVGDAPTLDTNVAGQAGKIASGKTVKLPAPAALPAVPAALPAAPALPAVPAAAPAVPDAPAAERALPADAKLPSLTQLPINQLPPVDELPVQLPQLGGLPVALPGLG
jgi:hypothetical protein